MAGRRGIDLRDGVWYTDGKGGIAVNRRYHLIDGLRGLAVVNMVLYHFLFDLFILQGFRPDWREIPAVHIWQQWICWTFILISGLSWHLGRHRVKNGLILNGCGLLVTAVTLIAEPEEAIWCGVLTLLGCALLLATALGPLLERIPALPGAIGSFCIFLLTRTVQSGTLSLGGRVLWALPKTLYVGGLATVLGFPAPGFYSSDYFPIFPWFFLYLTGLFAGRMILSRPPAILERRVPGLSWVGRHSLLIYLLHQPVAMVLSMAVGLLR